MIVLTHADGQAMVVGEMEASAGRHAGKIKEAGFFSASGNCSLAT